MKVRIYFPNSEDRIEWASVNLFLGGSIEMGDAVNWQSEVSEKLISVLDASLTATAERMLHKYTTPIPNTRTMNIFNPRRDDWDKSWPQDPSFGTQFSHQVNWEFDRQNSSNIIIYNFEAGTISPITLLELGLYINTDKKIFVVCPEEYHRYGNVKLTCNRFGRNINFYRSRSDDFYQDILTEIQKLTKSKELNE